MKSMKVLRLAMVAVPVLVFLGCGDTEPETSETPVEGVKLSSFWTELEGCTLCHSPSGEAADGPDLSTPELFVNNLVGKAVSDYPNWFVTSDCSNAHPFITAGDANASTLMAALVQEHSEAMKAENGCVSSFNYHEVSQASITRGSTLYNNLVEWINAGAVNN